MAERRIAYLWLPSFGVLVARKADRRLGTCPLVLLDDQGKVLDADAALVRLGVKASMTQQAAAARCAEAQFAPAARYPIPEAQDKVWRQVKRYTDRWQPDGLGRVYLDASHLAGDLVTWCQALARAMRHLGWEPALGATGSKFGAAVAGQAAGQRTAALLIPPAQRPFLAQQPIAALPLAGEAIQQLRYLGIRTLGQYARLPSPAVVTRFGPAGRTAQRWALGLDDRPVVPPWEAPEVLSHLEFDPPLADRERLMAALTLHAERLMAPLCERFQSVSRVVLAVTRADGHVVLGTYTFPQPTAATKAIRLGLAAALDRVEWNGLAAGEIILTLAGISEAPAPQLTLFDLVPDSSSRLRATLDRLTARFGSEAFRRATLTDPDHPLPEQRISWCAF